MLSSAVAHAALLESPLEIECLRARNESARCSSTHEYVAISLLTSSGLVSSGLQRCSVAGAGCEERVDRPRPWRPAHTAHRATGASQESGSPAGD